MRVTVYSTRKYERPRLESVGVERGFELDFTELPLEPATAGLARGSEAVCVFVNDQVSAPVLHLLSTIGVKFIALRCAGFNSVDLETAKSLGIRVARVPAYSPEAVAEHAFALLLGLSRKTHRAFNRVREMNFSLDGLVGFNLHGRTVGVVGFGQIGQAFARIALGFGMKVLVYDPCPTPNEIVQFVSLPELIRQSDVISLHCPLTPETRHLISTDEFQCMKPGTVLLNTSRGAVVDTKAAVVALKSGHLGGFGIDVYEEESGLFFHDLSDQIIQDEIFARLVTFPTVLVTGHQGFLTVEAIDAIVQTTFNNLDQLASDNLKPPFLVV